MLKKRILTCALTLATLAMASACVQGNGGGTDSADADLAKFDEQVAALVREYATELLASTE